MAIYEILNGLFCALREIGQYFMQLFVIEVTSISASVRVSSPNGSTAVDPDFNAQFGSSLICIVICRQRNFMRGRGDIFSSH